MEPSGPRLKARHIKSLENSERREAIYIGIFTLSCPREGYAFLFKELEALDHFETMLGLGMLLFSALTAAARFSGIPTAPLASGNGELRLSDLHAIVIDNQFADAVDKNGDTLIPPSLQDFMATFVNDLKVVNVNLGYERGSDIRNGTIFVTLGDPSDYRDVAGRRSSEGYALSISTNTIKIVGASPLGAWWATRTLLQAGKHYNFFNAF